MTYSQCHRAGKMWSHCNHIAIVALDTLPNNLTTIGRCIFLSLMYFSACNDKLSLSKTGTTGRAKNAIARGKSKLIKTLMPLIVTKLFYQQFVIISGINEECLREKWTLKLIEV